jgi:hypothetical protein
MAGTVVKLFYFHGNIGGFPFNIGWRTVAAVLVHPGLLSPARKLDRETHLIF